MALNISPQTSRELKNLVIETLLNTTDKVTKVSPDSVLSGLAGGIAKVGVKSSKDIILAISQLFPDTAFGEQLDQVALNFGIAPRFGAISSSTYVRLVGDPGTFYDKDLCILKSNSGIEFELENDVTIGSFGFLYAKVHSVTSGINTNVDALTINNISPAPSGHQYIINEVAAYGGRNIEEDEFFRIRIKDGANILSRGTIAMLEQKYISINPKVLRCFYQGINLEGKVRIAVATVDGSDLSNPELNELLEQGSDYFCFTDYKPTGTQFYGVELINVEYQPVDISFRVDLFPSVDNDEIRREIQISIMKYIDFRFFDAAKDRVEWDNILQIIKNTNGVKYVPDQFFTPRTDIAVQVNKLPRLRGFLMLDLEGNIIQNSSGTLTPVYYPNNPDFSYQQTVLNNI